MSSQRRHHESRRGFVGDDRAVGQPQVLANLETEDRAGRGSLSGTRSAIAASGCLAAGHVDHPDARTRCDQPRHGATATDLGVVGVRGEHEQIERGSHNSSTPC